jgi:hypothetical protein
MYSWKSSITRRQPQQEEWEYAAIADSEEYSIHSASFHRSEDYEFQSVANSEESISDTIGSDDEGDDESESDAASLESSSKPYSSSRPQQPQTPSLLNRALSFFYKKRVTFDRFATQVHEIPNTEHLTHEQFESMYYQRHELKRLRAERSRIVGLMNKGILNAEDDDMCCGLETEEDSYLRAKISEESVRRVVVQQARLWDEEDVDDKASSSSSSHQSISDVYFDSSFASHLEAHDRALQLERSIQGYATPSRWNSRRTEGPPALPRLGLGHPSTSVSSVESLEEDDDDEGEHVFDSVTSQYRVQAVESTSEQKDQQQQQQQQRQEAPKLPIRRYSYSPGAHTRVGEKKKLTSLSDSVSPLDTATLPPKLPIRRYPSTNSIDSRLSIRI